MTHTTSRRQLIVAGVSALAFVGSSTSAQEKGDTIEREKRSQLLDLAISAHGGAERWRQLSKVSAHVRGGGALWTVKGQEAAVAGDRTVSAQLHRQSLSFSPFKLSGQSASFTPDRVAILRADGSIVDERTNPRSSFAGHQRDTPWDDLQAVYFSGYALWNYLTEPFLFADAGFATYEIEPWREEEATWRRLRVEFPSDIATHCREQTFYFDKRGLLKRHDYSVEISGNTPAAQYVYNHKEFSGIIVPTKRQVFPRLPDGKPMRERLVISIDLDQAVFS